TDALGLVPRVFAMLEELDNISMSTISMNIWSMLVEEKPEMLAGDTPNSV
ncbi:hypothetical protein A2U01_0094918, partial [Trifolium medium]|nr:hypothetical protein [Trifolium medium]